MSNKNEFAHAAVTLDGIALLHKVHVQEIPLKFTKIIMGDGYMANGTEAQDQTAVVSPIITLSVVKLKRNKDGSAVIGGVFNNSQLETGFFYRELGLYAEDPDKGEILFAYQNAGDRCEWIPPSGKNTLVEKVLDIITTIGNAKEITAILQTNVYVESEDFERIIHEYDIRLEHIEQVLADYAEDLERIEGKADKNAADIADLQEYDKLLDEDIRELQEQVTNNTTNIAQLGNQVGKIGIATTEKAGLVKSGTGNLQVQVDSSGIMTVAGLTQTIQDNKTKVVNTLTSTSAIDALSAAMGKQLSDTITQFGENKIGVGAGSYDLIYQRETGNSVGAFTADIPKSLRTKYLALKIFNHHGNSTEYHWYFPVPELEFYNGRGEWVFENLSAGKYGITVTDSGIKFHAHALTSFYAFRVYGIK